MISIEEHGGIFGGSGFQFRGEYREVTLKNDVKYGDLVRVGTEFLPLPNPEGIDLFGNAYFSPGGKYMFVLTGNSNQKHPGLYERTYVGDNVEYRKLPNPTGFPYSVTRVNTVIFNNRENILIIFNDGREYGTFQIINGVWTKIDLSFQGKNYVSDGVFSPDDEYLVLKTGTTRYDEIYQTTVLRVFGLDSRASFSVHYPGTSGGLFNSNNQRPYFLTNRVLTSFSTRDQVIGTITASTMSVSNVPSLRESANYYALMDSGKYLVTYNSNRREFLLYEKATNNRYTEIPNASTSMFPSDAGNNLINLFPSEDLDKSVVYMELSSAAKYRMDRINKKFVRITGFNPERRDDISFPNMSQKMVPNTVDKIFQVRDPNNSSYIRLMSERVVGYKLNQDDQYNQDYIGIAKKGGKAGDKITVVKVTG